ncbi:MAG: dipeptidase, partial [Gammaproteobacteria bacterium]
MSTPRALVVTLTLICGLLIHTAAAQGQSTKDPALERATRLLRSTILVDGHNDLPMTIREFKDAPRDVIAYDLRQSTKGDTDIARLRAGGLGAQFWSVYIPGEGSGPYARQQLEQIDIARRVIERYPDVFMFAHSVADVRAAKRAGKIASMLGMEGGYGLENSIGALRAYHDLGVRYMALTHNTHTDWADAAAPLQPRNNGLTPFGEEIVREMNRLGMLIDLSHAAPSTMAHTLRVSAAPVIFSHSSAKAVCNVPRNVPDDILRELPKNGGVVMVTFVSSFINC